MTNIPTTADDLTFAEIQALKDDAIGHWETAHRHASIAVQEAWKCGCALIKLKESLAHGDWLPWIEIEGFGRETVRRWMIIAEKMTAGEIAKFTSVDAAIRHLPRPEPEESATDSNELTPSEKRLMEMEGYKAEARAAREEAAAANFNLQTAQKTIGALETELKIAGGKRQVRSEVEAAREEVSQLRIKLSEAEDKLTDTLRENGQLRRLVKSLKAAETARAST